MQSRPPKKRLKVSEVSEVPETTGKTSTKTKKTGLHKMTDKTLLKKKGRRAVMETSSSDQNSDDFGDFDQETQDFDDTNGAFSAHRPEKVDVLDDDSGDEAVNSDEVSDDVSDGLRRLLQSPEDDFCDIDGTEFIEQKRKTSKSNNSKQQHVKERPKGKKNLLGTSSKNGQGALMKKQQQTDRVTHGTSSKERSNGMSSKVRLKKV